MTSRESKAHSLTPHGSEVQHSETLVVRLVYVSSVLHQGLDAVLSVARAARLDPVDQLLDLVRLLRQRIPVWTNAVLRTAELYYILTADKS